MVLYMYGVTNLVTVITTMNLPKSEYSKKMDKTMAYMHKLQVRSLDSCLDGFVVGV